MSPRDPDCIPRGMMVMKIACVAAFSLVCLRAELVAEPAPDAPAAAPRNEGVDLLAAPLEESWSFFSEDAKTRMADVWQVRDGVLVCKGSPKGGLWLKRDLGDDFTLRLEWRWPAAGKAGKGGVLLRAVKPWKLWPKSLEAQLNAGDAGDFWGLDGYSLDGPEARKKTLDHPEFGKLTHLAKTAALEKPAGEWNQYEIVVAGPVVTLKVNGQVVNRAEKCDVTPGRICLTAEGHEIHFRNLRLN
jgi:hypothetical protein